MHEDDNVAAGSAHAGGAGGTLGCIPARDVRPAPNVRRWTIDLCPYVVFGVRKRDDPNDPERGRWDLVSSHPVRAVWRAPTSNSDEVCQHHRGHVTIGPDGHAQPIWCSDPSAGPFRQLHFGRMFIAGAAARVELGEIGRAGVFGRYHAPYWFEAVLFGTVARCGGVV